MIEIKNLTKNYGQNRVYDGFNLALNEGEITCVLGESGCGKTTLLNCLAGLTDFQGEAPSLKCSYVFQSPRLVPNLTVEQNLALICKDKNKIYEMLARVNLSDKAAAYPKTLSGGEAQRVALARAFLYEGEILLMDEPFSSLDLKLKKQIYELFSEVWQKDKRTVLFVTHDVDEALCLGGRIIVLKDGKTVFDCASAKNEDYGAKREKLVSALTEG